MGFGWFERIPLMYRYAAAVFTLVALGALLVFPGPGFLVHLSLAVALSLAFDLAFAYVKTRGFHTPYSAYITGIIIGLLLSPSPDFLPIVLVSLLAIGSKHFIRWKRRNIFNPAAFALVLGGMFLPVSVSWHGVSNLLLVVPLGLILMHFTKTLATGLSFFISFATILVFQALVFGNNPATILNGLVFIGSTVFFAFFMVVEPKTAPGLPNEKIIFGVLTAFLCFASLSLVPELFPLLGLLAGNALRGGIAPIARLKPKKFLLIIVLAMYAEGTSLHFTATNNASTLENVTIRNDFFTKNEVLISNEYQGNKSVAAGETFQFSFDKLLEVGYRPMTVSLESSGGAFFIPCETSIDISDIVEET